MSSPRGLRRGVLWSAAACRRFCAAAVAMTFRSARKECRPKGRRYKAAASCRTPKMYFFCLAALFLAVFSVNNDAVVATRQLVASVELRILLERSAETREIELKRPIVKPKSEANWGPRWEE